MKSRGISARLKSPNEKSVHFSRGDHGKTAGQSPSRLLAPASHCLRFGVNRVSRPAGEASEGRSGGPREGPVYPKSAGRQDSRPVPDPAQADYEKSEFTRRRPTDKTPVPSTGPRYSLLSVRRGPSQSTGGRGEQGPLRGTSGRESLVEVGRPTRLPFRLLAPATRCLRFGVDRVSRPAG